MADKTISELPAAGSLTGDELVLLEQNAKAKKASSGAFIAKVAEEVASASEFKEQIQNAVNDYLEDVVIDDSVVAGAVDEWLDNHPEATTTVQDESLTEAKFSDVLKLKTIKDYVTPEMFGAKGDGVTDDTVALEAAFNSGKGVVLLRKGATYLVTNPRIETVNDLSVIGYGATIKVNKDFTFVSSLQAVCLFIENSTNIKLEGVTFDASWREIKELHGLEVDTTLENFCVRLFGGNDGVTFYKCIFGNQLKVCLQTKGSYLGGDRTDPASVDPTFVPNVNIDIGYCTFGWNYTPGLHNGAIQFLELPQVETDINAKIHDNLILVSGVHGMHIYHGNNNVIIENNTVLDSGHCVLEPYFIGGGSVVFGYGIEVTSCNKITIKNNFVRNFIAGGIVVFDDGWYEDGDIHSVLIDGNTIEQDSEYSDEFKGHAVIVKNGTDSIVSGNICKGCAQTKDNGANVAGIALTYSKNILVTGNDVEGCEDGIIVHTCDFMRVVNNSVKSLANNFRNCKGIDAYIVNDISISGNVIERGDSTITNFNGISFADVKICSVSGNVFDHIRYAILHNSGVLENTTIYGCVFNGVTNKYVWWGTHTDLVVDFVALTNS